MADLLTTDELLLATFIVFVAGTVQGSAGVGFAIISAPMLRVVVPDAVPVGVMVSAVLISALMIRREQQAIELSGAGWVIAGRVPGGFIGAALLISLPTKVLDVSIGVMVLIAVAIMALGVTIPFNRATKFVTGVISGATGTATSIGGPPLAMLYRERRGPEMRATLATIFLIGLLVNLAILRASGEIGTDDLKLGALLIPGSLAGVLASSTVRHRIEGERLRQAVLVLSTLAALSLLAQTLI